VVQMRPYSNKLNEVLVNVSAGLETSENAYAQQREISKVLIVAVTSDKGLCGGFNSNITKKVSSLMADEYQGKDITVLNIGKKAKDFSRRAGLKVNDQFAEMFVNLSFENAQVAASYVMNAFLKGEFDVVRLVFNEFKNVATQEVHADQFLPIEQKEEQQASVSTIDYIYEPSKQYILEQLIPKSLKTQFYTALLDSNASEHGARMTAMDKATDNAGELLKELKLIYNRTRQAAITTEILEIVGGAEALASGK
jgi:F-type H+-transporting ATPase subunit gamma